MFEKVEIYSKSNCIFCDKAKHLFNSMNIEYVEHNAEDQATVVNVLPKELHDKHKHGYREGDQKWTCERFYAK